MTIHQQRDGHLIFFLKADCLCCVVSGNRGTSRLSPKLVPAEVESALISHPAVLGAAVVARQDENELEKPAAYVVLNKDVHPGTALAGELQDLVAEKLGAYKRPRWIEFLPELPKTATGKLQRYKLRDRKRVE